jgi:hypothetical protein
VADRGEERQPAVPADGKDRTWEGATVDGGAQIGADAREARAVKPECGG